MARPLDPRLLRAVSSARSAVVTTAVGVVAQTAAVVIGALLLADALDRLVTGDAGWSDVVGQVVGFGVAALVRALLAGLTERRAHRGATRVIADLRERVLAHAVALGPRWVEANRTEVTTLVTRGLDALEPYLVRYLPQLLQTAILTPALLVVMATQDVLAAVTLALLLPLIPLFMWLIGLATQRTARRRLAAQQRLNARVLDLVAGLPTLRAFGRAGGTVARVRELADAERRGTMSTLRIAFLSGAVLEMLATLSVAVIAVEVGLRLVTGDLHLVVGLTALILAPEVLAPLRHVGTHFHASADGVAAVERCLAILDEEPAAAGRGAIGAVDEIVWDDVSVIAPGRSVPTPSGLSGSVRPGEITVLAGPSGSGKTTAILTLLGLLPPTTGRVRLRAGERWHDLADVDVASWRAQVAWVPQRPVLEPGTLLDVLGSPTPADLERAARASGFDAVVATLPDGWRTRVGGQARGLSAGQRQRLALTRALLDGLPYLVLDEPTAHLDAASTQLLVGTLRSLAASGCAVLVLTHAPALVAAADRVIRLDAAVGATR